MQCLQCQHENREGRRFCAECGAPLSQLCTACAFVNEPGDKFCGGCGLSLNDTSLPSSPPVVSVPLSPTSTSREPHLFSYTPQHLAEKILTSRHALEGERKQVTVLFCDLANSTGLAELLGPEMMHTVLNRFFELALDAVHRYEGTINQFLGDGFMALFGAPIAHEDHAHRAVLAAVALRQQLQAGNAAQTHPRATELTIRMGLNTGIVVVGAIGDNLRMDYTAIGDTTNVAARLQSVAGPGQIVLSDATHRLVSGYCTTHNLGTFSLKGKDEPVHAWNLTSVQEIRTRLAVETERGLTPFVGRQDELRVLHNCFAEAQAGHGPVVLLTGDAGVGKSRLLAEFKQQLEAQPCTWLHGRCLSYGQDKAYLPIIDFVKHAFQIDEGDDDATINAKIDRVLPSLGEAFGSALPHLKNL
jgi:class 3 adenylate cyclase